MIRIHIELYHGEDKFQKTIDITEELLENCEYGRLKKLITMNMINPIMTTLFKIFKEKKYDTTN